MNKTSVSFWNESIISAEPLQNAEIKSRLNALPTGLNQRGGPVAAIEV